ncbi:MAG: LPS assembly lipoprotein LptE [Alphaproteobacteria bacterium]
MKNNILLALFLSSCGYTPLYQPINGQTLASHIQVATVEMERFEEQNVGERRTAQLMSQRLRQDLPTQAATLDTLTVAIREDASALALRRTALVEREQLTLTARVNLQSPEGKPLFKTEVASTTAYNVETTPYATESGKVFARQTAARNLAEEILRRLNLFYRAKK